MKNISSLLLMIFCKDTTVDAFSNKSVNQNVCCRNAYCEDEVHTMGSQEQKIATYLLYHIRLTLDGLISFHSLMQEGCAASQLFISTLAASLLLLHAIQSKSHRLTKSLPGRTGLANNKTRKTSPVVCL
jgi:hypothetical protein